MFLKSSNKSFEDFKLALFNVQTIETDPLSHFLEDDRTAAIFLHPNKE